MIKRKIRFIIIVIIVMLSVIQYACNDDNITQPVKSGQLSATNLKPLNKNIDGVYEAWASVETSLDHDESAYKSLGRFNISATGNIIDTNGNPFGLNLSKIPNINSIGDVIITIDPPGYTDTVPSNIKILGGVKTQQGSELIFNMSLDNREILPPASQFSAAVGNCLLASPTTGSPSSQFQRGLWFTNDTNGNSPGLTLPILPDTSEWTYQAWIIDSRDSLNRIYNIGRFDSVNRGDSYGQCKGSFPAWNLPGNDWIQNNCPGGIPDITDLNNGYYKVLITLEPRFDQGVAISMPFYLHLFEAIIIPGAFGKVLTLTNTFGKYIPSAVMRLTVN